MKNDTVTLSLGDYHKLIDEKKRADKELSKVLRDKESFSMKHFDRWEGYSTYTYYYTKDKMIDALKNKHGDLEKEIEARDERITELLDKTTKTTVEKKSISKYIFIGIPIGLAISLIIFEITTP